MPLYPLKFKPWFMEKIWGGRKIQTVLGKEMPPGKIGESWELYDIPPGVVQNNKEWLSSEVANGPLAGRRLHDLVGQLGEELYGDVGLVNDQQFPILIKYLDAGEDLSVQVHPDAEYCRTHPGSFLKTEAWYIVQHDPEAQLLRGLMPGVTREAFAKAIEDGTVEKLIRAIKVKDGECYFLRSGTVHTLGKGVLAAEVQTPSDSTFRVYDFNRVDSSTGRPRPLHVQQALECIDFTGKSNAPQERSHVASVHTTVTRLCSCEFFTMEKVRFVGGVQQQIPYDQPVVWMMLEGEAELSVADVAEVTTLGKGDTVLLPAKMNKPTLRTKTDCVWIEVTFPTKR